MLFWYVIKKTKKSSIGAACSPIYPPKFVRFIS